MKPTRLATGDRYDHIMVVRKATPLSELDVPGAPQPLVWCETPRPEAQCRCGLYALLWEVSAARPSPRWPAVEDLAGALHDRVHLDPPRAPEKREASGRKRR